MKDLIMRLLKVYFEDAIALVKIRAVSYYVKAVGAVRSLYIKHIVLACMLLLMLAGFILMHVGLFIALPCSPEWKGGLLPYIGGSVLPSIAIVCAKDLLTKKLDGILKGKRYGKGSY